MTIVTLLDGEEVRAESLHWSSTDPGGFDQCSFRLQRRQAPEPGTPVLVLDGLETCWEGIVDEPGRRQEHGREAANIVAVGRADELGRNPYSMIYLDRDLSQWKSMSRSRQVDLITFGLSPIAHVLRADDTNGSPTLCTELTGPWTASSAPICEPLYDAGPGNLLSKIKATWTKGVNVSAVDPSWFWSVSLQANDAITGQQDTSGTLVAVGPGSVTVVASGDRRYANIRHNYGAVTAGTNGMIYAVNWTDVRLIGNHTVPIGTTSGASPVDMVQATDIAVDAIQRSHAKFDRIVGSPGDFAAMQHVVYRESVMPRVILEDMAKYLAWHWGVWESRSTLAGSQPTVMLIPRPTLPTATVRYEDCASAEVVEKFTEMHDRVTVKFSTPVEGSGGYVEVVSPHPRGGGNLYRPLLVDVGIVGNSGIATALGRFLLALDQANGRATGSATLPAVTLEGRPSHLLRPGRDRLGIIGLPASGGETLLTASSRSDSVRAQRLEVEVDRGVPRATVQFNPGTDLVESLNARLGIASVLAGVG